jgi:LAO/AO transport system kinase
MSKDKPNKSALSVSKGVKQPPSVNPNLQKRKRKNLSAEDYVSGITNGNRTILSQAITLVESSLPEHAEKGQEIIEQCLPLSGKSIRIGITGVPGVGKSSFIESIGIHLTANKHRLAVLAIDPSSERSKGSILGDKTRMEILSAQPDAFIRPSPSAGSLGGVARKTRESILLCEAAGFDVIFVETVGVGQSEIAVHSMVDFFLLLMLAGAGDELQGIKRGIMEMADMLAITKADGSNQENAQRAAAEYTSALHLFPASESGWTPQVLTCSAIQNKGMEDLWEKIVEYRAFTGNNGYFLERRKKQSLYWMNETIQESLQSRFYGNKDIQHKLEQLRREVIEDKTSSFVAAQQIISYYYGKKLRQQGSIKD